MRQQTADGRDIGAELRGRHRSRPPNPLVDRPGGGAWSRRRASAGPVRHL